MPIVDLHGGMRLEIPNRKEIADIVRQEREDWAAHQRANMRTMKFMSVATPLNTPASTHFHRMPESAYVWNLKLVSVQLSQSDTVQLFIASEVPATGATPVRLISNFGAAATSQVATWSSSQVYVRPGEGLYFVASTYNLTAFYITAEEAMAEKAAAIYD